jgi:hypothetical protein
VSFCLVDWKAFCVVVAAALHCTRCDAMQCCDLLFTFVFCRDLWCCFWPSSQPPQGFMVFFWNYFMWSVLERFH